MVHKFKMWDKINKKWLDAPIIDGANGKAMGFDLLAGEFQRHYSDDEVEIIEFTGLKDNFGQEIYEGDIVEREVFAFGEFRVFTGQVKNYECRWWIDNESAAVPLWSEMHVLKVIGNIHEDPELLTA